MSNEAEPEHQDHSKRKEKLTEDATVTRDNSPAERECSETRSTSSKAKDHTANRDNSPAEEQSSESSLTSSKAGLHMPNLESSSNSTKQTSHSRAQGRFWSLSSDAQEMPMILPKLTDWSPIREPKRRRNLEYTLSHSNRTAALNLWSWVLKRNNYPTAGQYSSDMAEFCLQCLKSLLRCSAYSAGQA